MNTPAAYAGLGFLTGTALTIAIIVGIVYYILLVVAWWKLFTKAGEKGWKAIIPFYNLYTQIKLTWATKWFWVILIVAVLTGVVGNSGIFNTLSGPLMYIFGAIGVALSVFLLVLYILCDYRLAKAYGHGAGFTVGLIFLNFIFILVLGLGKSKYEGNVYLKEKKK